MNRASRRNEGKIHLGLVYAMDASGATAALQLKGALSFRALLARWVEAAESDLGCSTPFQYTVAPESLLPAEELARRYERMEEVYARVMTAEPDLDYLGQRPARLTRRLPESAWAGRFGAERVAAVFDTAERAIDTDRLAERICTAVARSSNIRFFGGRKALAIERLARGFGITQGEGAAEELRAAQVVNATWDGRMALDATMGLAPAPGWLHRLKYRVIVRLDPAKASVPSATMVVGRYGDVVIRPDATAYLSWYPAALRGWSDAICPPADWAAACRGQVEPGAAAALAGEVKAAIDGWYPGLTDGETLTVDAGAILAHGRTDVDDPASGLHDRTKVGVTNRDGYVSVNPGKLTTAPLFAMAAADAVTGNAPDDLGALAGWLERPLT